MYQHVDQLPSSLSWSLADGQSEGKNTVNVGLIKVFFLFNWKHGTKTGDTRFLCSHSELWLWIQLVLFPSVTFYMRDFYLCNWLSFRCGVPVVLLFWRREAGVSLGFLFRHVSALLSNGSPNTETLLIFSGSCSAQSSKGPAHFQQLCICII